MAKYISNSESQTKKIAAKLARENHGKIFALTGELGAGKTVFVQGFAKGLGIKEKIISPTFVLIKEHLIPRSNRIFYHIDLYRIENTAHLGLQDLFSDPDNIILIEWADKIKNILPENTVKISITKDSLQKRTIIIS